MLLIPHRVPTLAKEATKGVHDLEGPTRVIMEIIYTLLVEIVYCVCLAPYYLSASIGMPTHLHAHASTHLQHLHTHMPCVHMCIMHCTLHT